MSWEVDFNARPFKLALRRTDAARARLVRYAPLALPDSLYRTATRRALARLARDNRELRHRPSRRSSLLTVALAEAIERWARRKWPEDPS